MSVLSTDNDGAGPDLNAPVVHVPVVAHPTAQTVFSRAAEIQRKTNEAHAEHLQQVKEFGKQYTPETRAALVPEILKSFQKEPIWQQAMQAEADADARVAELEQAVDNEKRALTPDLDTAGELRQSRALDRAERTLSHAEDGWKGQAAAKILRDASDADVGILVRELPHLLPDDVPPEVLEPAIRERAPEYAAAQRKLTTAQRGAAIIKSNGAKLRRSVAEHIPSVGVLPLKLPSGQYDPDAV